jgi:ribosomal protein S14
MFKYNTSFLSVVITHQLPLVAASASAYCCASFSELLRQLQHICRACFRELLRQLPHICRASFRLLLY